MKHSDHRFQSSFQVLSLRNISLNKLDLVRHPIGLSAGVDTGLQRVQDANLVAALEQEIDRVRTYESGSTCYKKQFSG